MPHRFRANSGEAVVVCAILTSIVFLSQWRYGFNMGDEGFQWYLSQRVLFGEMPIRDFFGYDPGRYLWSAAWFKVLGADGLFEQRLANTCFGFVGLTLAYLAMAEADIRRAVRLSAAVLLAIAMAYPLHKVYEQSLSLIGTSILAYCLSAPANGRRWTLLGLTTGAAAIFGRNSGVYLVIASLLAWIFVWTTASMSNAYPKLAKYLTGVVLGYLPMIGWFVADGRFRRALISTLFTQRWQLPLPIPFPWTVAQSISSIHKVQATAISWLCVAVFTLYLTYGFILIRRYFNHESIDRRCTLGLSALFVGLPFLHQGFDRADFGHIAQGILPLFILLTASFEISHTFRDHAIVIGFATLVLLCWLPSAPLLAALISRHHDQNSITDYPIDGRLYRIDTGFAQVLRETTLLAARCNTKDGQVVAMPYYPGILAYLHLRSPYWETYYLYQRDADFQKREITSMEFYKTKLAIVNSRAAIDSKDSLRIASTNPVLYDYVTSHFSANETLGDFDFLTRDCP